MSLKIGNVIIPRESGFGITQTYDEILSRTLLRTKSGAGIIQSRWKKIGSSISGTGWHGAALDAIDSGVSHAVSCIKPLTIYSATTSLTLQHSYRTDAGYTVAAYALVGDTLVSTPVSMASQVATITAVSGASQYQVDYYPILTCMLTILKSGNVDEKTASWSIEAKEL